MLEDFSYDSYKELVDVLRSKNLNLCFEDFPLDYECENYFILRHDVDFSCEDALRMAEFEAKLGIRASYFMLFSSPFYNLLSEEYCRVPLRLVEMGHGVGLHYDTSTLTIFGTDNLLGMFEVRVELLTKLTGKKVKAIAMHNPAIGGADPFKNSKEFVNAYDEQYTKRIDYFSDSAGVWKDEAIEALRPNNIPPRLQLLIHPFFWGESSKDRWTRLDDLKKKLTVNLSGLVGQIKEGWSVYSA